ncbi:MAG: hypothetical protein NWS71_04845 [Opitutales bacterium]|jgi:hypothetical protein|nr:hypothetical protein [Opitutales bacterium]MDP4883939.1 hypothetical protein [Opitutales bacterium]MDP5080311.1 hypothetical protein [Opitutales bacterium]
MSRILILCLLSLHCFNLTAWSLDYSNAGIKLSIEPETCAPGDIIQLTAEMTRADYAELALKIPTHPSLHFVAETNSPITYTNGLYSQTTIWTLQPVRSDRIEIANIIAEIKQGEHIETVKLPTLSVIALPDAAQTDTDAPMQLPTASETVNPSSRQWLIAAFLILLALTISGIAYLRRLKAQPEPLAQDPAPTLQDLLQSLESGQLPTKMIEQILANDQITLSESTRAILERAIYASHPAPEVLLAALQKEVAK